MLKHILQQAVTNAARRSVLVALDKAKAKKMDLQDPLHREEITDMVLAELGGNIESTFGELTKAMQAAQPRPRRPIRGGF